MYCLKLFFGIVAGLSFSLSILAAPRTRLEPLITTDGAIVLRVTQIEGAKGSLTEIREYAVQVSEDLVEWEELSRSRLASDLELVDREAIGRPARFYRVVGVEVDDVIRLFSEALADEMTELQGYASGIVLDGVTLEEYRAMQERVEEIRQAIVNLLESGALVPESLLIAYKDKLGAVDRTVRANPLRIEKEGIVLEIDVSKAMETFNRQYARLGTVSPGDYDRLPGVDAGDLEGLQLLDEYLDSRRVGLSSNLPVFESLSPYGNFELTHRLISKFFDILAEDTQDADADGALEIDYGVYFRLLDGREQLQRAAPDIVSQVAASHTVDFSPVEGRLILTSDLDEVLGEVDSYCVSLDAALTEYVKKQGFDSVFEEALLSDVWQISEESSKPFLKKLVETLRRSWVDLELFEKKAFPLFGTEVTARELMLRHSMLMSWRESLRTSGLSFLESHSFHPRLEKALIYAFDQRFNGYSSGWTESGVYGDEWRALEDSLFGGSIRFFVIGRGYVSVEGSVFGTDSYYELTRLISMPRFKGLLTDEFVERLVTNGEWNRSGYVNFWDNDYYDENLLSAFAVRVQLMGFLLEHFGDEILVNGAVNRTRLSLLFLSDENAAPELLTYLDAIEEARAQVEAIETAAEGDFNYKSFHWSEYAALFTILKTAGEAYEDAYVALGSPSSYADETGERRVLDAAWAGLLSYIGRFFPTETKDFDTRFVAIEIGGKQHRMKLSWLKTVFERAMGQVAVPLSGDMLFVESQLVRLSGIDKDTLAPVEDEYSWERAVQVPNSDYWFSHVMVDPIAERRLDSVEFYYLFLPQLLEQFGERIVSDEGVLDEKAIEEQLLEGAQLITADGMSILEAHATFVDSVCRPNMERLKTLDFSLWESWLEGKEILIEAHQELGELVGSLISTLNESEIERMEGQANGAYAFFQSTGQSGWMINYYDLWDKVYGDGFRTDWVSMDVGGSERLKVPVEELCRSLAASNFRWSETLGTNVVESDFLAARRISSKVDYRGLGSVYSSRVSEQNLVLELVSRFYRDREELPGLIRSGLFVGGSVTKEVFRRWVTGIDERHHRLVEKAKDIVSAALPDLVAAGEKPTTMENLYNLHESLMGLREELRVLAMGQVNDWTFSDMTELEEEFSEVFAEAFSILDQALLRNDLYIDSGNGALGVDYGVISESLIRQLELRFPGEALATYHFASFYGLSVADLREYHKLETYLDEQIVHLTDSYQTVRVASRLSQIGMRELVVDLLNRFGEDALGKGGAVDVERLIALVSDEELGIARAKSSLDRVVEATFAFMSDIKDPASVRGIDNVVSVLSNWRSLLLEAATDQVTSLSPSGFAAVQAYANELNDRVLKRVAEMVLDRSIRVDLIDGGSVELNISQFEPALEAMFLDLIGTKEVEYELNLERGSTPTRLGLHQIVARLVAAFGNDCIQDGTLSLERFRAELERTSLQRAGGLFERLKQSEARLYSEFEGKLGIQTELEVVRDLQVALDESRIRYQSQIDRLYPELASDWKALKLAEALTAAWRSRVAWYESKVKREQLNLLVQGKERLVPLSALVAVMHKRYAEGYTVFLDTFAKGGESRWNYSSFADLWAKGYDFAGYFGTNADQDAPGDYDFTLGDIAKLVGVKLMDLRGIDSESNQDLRLARLPAEELVVGELGLRVGESGMPVYTAMFSRLSVGIGDVVFGGSDGYELRFGDLSWRDQRFRVIPEILNKYGAELFSEDGAFRTYRFDELLQSLGKREVDDRYQGPLFPVVGI